MISYLSFVEKCQKVANLDGFIWRRFARVALLLQGLPALPLSLQLLKPACRFFQSWKHDQKISENASSFGIKINKTTPRSGQEVTFLEGFVDVNLTRDKVLVVLHVGEDPALVDPVVVVWAEEEDGEVSDIVAKALNVWRNQTGVADLGRPPPVGTSRCNERKTNWKEAIMETRKLAWNLLLRPERFIKNVCSYLNFNLKTYF